MSLNSVQCRLARAALNLGVRDLAKVADVSPNTIARLERGEPLHARTTALIRGALEAEGVTFLDSGTRSFGGGDGVRVGGQANSSYAELFERLWSIPDLRRKPVEAKHALFDVFARYLDIIEEQDREPDIWERLDLNEALQGLAANNLHLAFAYLRHGITPPDNQSPDYPISAETAAQTEGMNLEHFRRCLAQIRPLTA